MQAEGTGLEATGSSSSQQFQLRLSARSIDANRARNQLIADEYQDLPVFTTLLSDPGSDVFSHKHERRAQDSNL